MAAGASRNGEQAQSLFVQCLLVKHVFSEAWTDALQIGNVLRDFLDRLHLLVKVFTFQPVSHLIKTNNEATADSRLHPQHAAQQIRAAFPLRSRGSKRKGTKMGNLGTYDATDQFMWCNFLSRVLQRPYV